MARPLPLAAIALSPLVVVHVASAQSFVPTATVWGGLGYEAATTASPRGPLREGLVVHIGGDFPMLPGLALGLRIGGTTLRDGPQDETGFTIGAHIGIDFGAFVHLAGYGSTVFDAINPEVGIGADVVKASFPRDGVGRGIFYVADTIRVLCYVGVRVSLDVSMGSWEHTPPTVWVGAIVGQQWGWGDSFTTCSEARRWGG